jgi:hypothetical protein
MDTTAEYAKLWTDEVIDCYFNGAFLPFTNLIFPIMKLADCFVNEPIPVTINKAVLIYNPVSGNGAALKWVEKSLPKLLEKYPNVSVRKIPTEFAGHLKEIFNSISKLSCDCVILAGGDGTIHEAVQCLTQNSPPVGIIPAGTGNSLA